MDIFPFPRVLRIEPASQCNLACMHCPTGTVSMNRGIIEDATFNIILQQIQHHKEAIKIIVLYHGGEPLLNKAFSTMVKRIKSINPHFFIKTVSNAMALTNKRAHELIDCGLDAIEFSLDGISPEESELVRRKSNVKKIIKNIQNLIDLKHIFHSQSPQISIATTQFFSPLFQKDFYPKAITPSWLLSLFNPTDIDKFKATYAMRWPHMGDSGAFDEIQVSHEPHYNKYCDHVINTLTIRADGSIVPCCFDLTNQMIMGNILQDSLSTIWNNDAYRQLRQTLTEQHTLPKLCQNCLLMNNPIYLIPKWRAE